MGRKDNVVFSVSLTRCQVEFLDSLSRRCAQGGGARLSRNFILRNLVKVLRGFDMAGLKKTASEDEIVEYILWCADKFNGRNKSAKTPRENNPDVFKQD